MSLSITPVTYRPIDPIRPIVLRSPQERQAAAAPPRAPASSFVGRLFDLRA